MSRGRETLKSHLFRRRQQTKLMSMEMSREADAGGSDLLPRAAYILICGEPRSQQVGSLIQ
jgi:hypothetical protein